MAASLHYLREVYSHSLGLTSTQFKLDKINPTEGFYRGVASRFLSLFIHTYKLHFYSILVLDKDLKSIEALLRKTCQGKEAGILISQVYPSVFTYKLPEVSAFGAKAICIEDFCML